MLVLKDAQAGALLIENLSVPRAGLLTLGVKTNVCPAIKVVLGWPEMLSASAPVLPGLPVPPLEPEPVLEPEPEEEPELLDDPELLLPEEPLEVLPPEEPDDELTSLAVAVGPLAWVSTPPQPDRSSSATPAASAALNDINAHSP